jgi:hypothetical protein
MNKTTSNLRPIALAQGSLTNSLWVACDDGSIWRLIATTSPPPPVGMPADRDPDTAWTWEKMPVIPG